MTPTGKRIAPIAILITVVVAILIITLIVTAIATNFFGQRNIAIPYNVTAYIQECPDNTVVEDSQPLISLQGFTDNPEHAATVEWQEFIKGYDIEAVSAIGDNVWEYIPEEYLWYGAYTLEMVNKIHEITEKYGLTLLGKNVDTKTDTPIGFHEYFQANLANAPLFTDDSIWFQGLVFENGSFHLYTSYGMTAFQFFASRKGVLDIVDLNIGGLDDYVEWNYENAHGSQLYLAQSRYESFILFETDVFFFTVNLLAGPGGDAWQSQPPFIRSDLEQFADLIDFGQIKSDLPALVRHELPAFVTSEALKAERSRIIAKRAELDAQRGKNLAALSPFVGMWSYVSSEADGETVLPLFYQDWLLIDADSNAIFWNGEEVIEKIMNNERADPKLESRFIFGSLTPLGNDEFDLEILDMWNYTDAEVYGMWDYTDEETSFVGASWDLLRLQYIPARDSMRFTDWNGVHHFYERES